MNILSKRSDKKCLVSAIQSGEPVRIGRRWCRLEIVFLIEMHKANFQKKENTCNSQYSWAVLFMLSQSVNNNINFYLQCIIMFPVDDKLKHFGERLVQAPVEQVQDGNFFRQPKNTSSANRSHRPCLNRRDQLSWRTAHQRMQRSGRKKAIDVTQNCDDMLFIVNTPSI